MYGLSNSAISDDLEWPSMSFVYRKLFQVQFLQFCSSSHGFNWFRESRSHSAIAELFAIIARCVITPPKVNRFGYIWSTEHIVGGWPWQILGAIRTVATSDSLRGSRNFVFLSRNNAWFHRFSVGQISRNLNTTTSIGEAVKTFGTEFRKFYC